MQDLRNKLLINNGFTLIELLVTVTIIGLLATVATFSANKALERNRDLKRQALINQTADALEKYYFNNRLYPDSASTWNRDFVKASSSFTNSSANVTPIISNLTPTYMAALPRDPKFNPATEIRGFMYYSDGTNYKLVSYNNVESARVNATNQLFDSIAAQWDCAVLNSYSVFSPNGSSLYWGAQNSVSCP